MSVVLQSSGGGSVTLQEPSTASNRTLTLPDVTATVLTNSSGVLDIGSGQVYKDASGNVGIGVTPSTWSNGSRGSLEFQQYGNIAFQGPYASLITNAYFNDAWYYKTSATAALYQQYTGAHIFSSAASGTANAALTWSERMRIDSSGNVLVTSAAGLGYGTGAGGTVTQGSGSGKSTAVTLNKPTGQIVTNNASLGASGTVSFVLNNSLIATTDNVIVNSVSNGNYLVQCISNGAGTATIRITNITGGSLSEQFSIQFSIIKGATA